MESFFSKLYFFRICQDFNKILSQNHVISSVLEAVKNFSDFPMLKMMIMVSAVLFSRKPFFLMIKLNKMRWRRERDALESRVLKIRSSPAVLQQNIAIGAYLSDLSTCMQKI